MKILKYLFLLFLLSFVALTVFIATQKGDFSVERSKVINSPRTTVFNYINDFRNFEDYESLAVQNSTIRVSLSRKTFGNGAAVSWQGEEGSGSARILKSVEAEGIRQSLSFEGTEANIQWTFKDTLNGKTKVTWKAEGTMSFLFKIYTALNGGSDNIIGTISEKSLVNIDRNLVYENKTYAIKVNGLAKKQETFYIKQTFTSEISKIHKNAKAVIPKLTDFSKKNDLYLSGKPFIIYHTYNPTAGLAKISICLPISKEISISPGSDILAGKLNGFEAVKTTLTGDYVYLPKAISQSASFISAQNIIPELTWSHLEILTTSKLDVRKSSKLVTEIYFPVKPKVIPVESPVVTQPEQPKQVKEAQKASPPATTAPEEEESEF
jgi:effector-binding domain-containing protein